LANKNRDLFDPGILCAWIVSVPQIGKKLRHLINNDGFVKIHMFNLR